jgi:hypothetical protein
MKEELKQIIQELKEVIIEEKINITDSELLDSSLRIYLTQTINKQKTNNYLKNELSPQEKLEPKENDGLATKNQIYFLKKNGITIPFNLTKKRAFELIKELKK